MHTNSPLHTGLCALAFSITILLVSFSQSEAYTVSNLSAEYHNGQIFLTWTNPNVHKLQYNVYRSVVPFTLSSQLNSSTFLGYVRDSSSKNIFWSKQSGGKVFYKITPGGQPLAASKGLYVVTCTGSLLYYYVVTVTNLSNDLEDKTIGTGNCTLLPVLDVVAQPLPVFQDSFRTNDGEEKQLYVQYVNNQETALYPAMNATGSYGFNFFIVKRGTATRYPLFVIYEGFGNKADVSVGLNKDYSNCYVIGLFDWLPIPLHGGGVGDNTFFCGYDEKFNIYSNSNAIPTSGIVKLYTQKMNWQAINWLESQVPIDTTRLYVKGTSHNGFGALLAASLMPEKIAAVYCAIEPNAVAACDDVTMQMWGKASSRLKTDRREWNSNDTLLFNDIKNQGGMLSNNKLRTLPPIYDVHGKQDETVVWNSGMINWLNSLENNSVGGAWYWDQRNHSGGGKNFIDGETQPNFYRFATNISYPAFSHCSANQNPGTGKPSNGDPYGSINGYLDWDDANIVDKACNYSIHVFVKDFYVGGVLDPEQYSTCTTDIAIRRMQKFHPSEGTVINWSNFDDVTGIKIQEGTFTYDGGLLSIPGLTINKTGNKIKFNIANCGRIGNDPDGSGENDDQSADARLYFSKSPDGYTAHIDLLHPDGSGENAQVLIYDLMGRMVWEKKAALASGTNTIEIPAPATGIFLVQVRGKTFSKTEKLFF
ncbi:MAG TPA: T9SS type A sorting domain-containing protein [Chitinophagales bacterium]|nr:T9SS type A sorting domain-containing protein [Chitinophagales bacterium]